MKGLIIKDFYNLRKQIVLYLIIGVLYSVIGAASTDTGGTSFTGFIMILSAMMPITAVSYDERAKWDKYGLTMPVSRKDTVAAKYILGLIFTVSGAVVSLITGFIFGADMEEYLMVIAVIAGVCFLYLSVLLPIVYKMGTEKARFIMIAVILLPVVLIMAGASYFKKSTLSVIKVPESDVLNLQEKAAAVTPSGLTAGFLIFIAVSIVILYISYRISVSIYSRKEF
ncbi:MAG: ABC-2 transporter permease [Firmicutes bacterium]|nr:ABC-2 transporter permease [Bacillota bacterium]